MLTRGQPIINKYIESNTRPEKMKQDDTLTKMKTKTASKRREQTDNQLMVAL